MNTNRRQVLIGGVLAATVATSAAGTDPDGPTRSPVRAEYSNVLARLFASRPAPALSLAVARSTGVIHAEAMGGANIELGIAASPTHRFPLGSISKVITATVAARLVSRKTIALDRPIGDYLPELPIHHRATTLRQLLTHQGGVRHFGAQDLQVNGPGGPIYMRSYASDEDVLGLFINDPLIGPPGAQVHYSTYGYTLASMVLQAAAGMDFRELVKVEIGAVLALPSLVPEDPWSIIADRACRYMNQADVNILYAGLAERARPRLTNGFANMPMSNPAYSWAGAGFLMTPADAALFGAAFLPGSPSEITEADRDLLFTPITQRTGQTPALGLGWRIDRDSNDRLRWRHEGATPGGCFALAIYPELDLSLALAGNVMAMPIDLGRASVELADAAVAAA